MNRLKINWPLFALGVALQAAGAVLRLRAIQNRKVPLWTILPTLVALQLTQIMVLPLRSVIIRGMDSVAHVLAHWRNH